MYQEYFGLKELPFSIAPDPRYLYLSEQHREALAHLVYGINSEGGFVLLTGEVGTGKTTVCRCLLEQIPENTNITFILNPKLTVSELLATFCDERDIRYPEGNTSNKVFIDKINSYLLEEHARGRKTVLIIEEAQNLSTDVLEQVRLLTNLETDQKKLLQIIMLGQPELQDMLLMPELRQLAQRITARYHLGPLTQKEVAGYVNHRMAVAGGHSQLFPIPTINKLFHLSEGIPRVINVLCDRALLGAYVQGKKSVDKTTLINAAREVFGQEKVQDQSYRKSFRWALAGLLAILCSGAALTAAYYYYWPYPSEKPSLKPVIQESISNPTPEPPTLDTLKWPAGQQISRSKVMGYQALFKQWDILYNPHVNSSACQYAEEHGLRCLHQRGSLGSLRHINRPAVLKLFNTQDQEFYATVTGLKGDTATFIIGTETKTVDIKDLESRWLGEYTLLWRVPPHYQDNILPGYQGPTVQWLENQLALIQGRLPQSKEKLTFDAELVKHVKEFQLSEGLVPDGIVGPKTLININTENERGVPLLIRKQEES